MCLIFNKKTFVTIKIPVPVLSRYLKKVPVTVPSTVPVSGVPAKVPIPVPVTPLYTINVNYMQYM